MTTITRIINHYYFHCVRTLHIYSTIFTLSFISSLTKNHPTIVTPMRSSIIQLWRSIRGDVRVFLVLWEKYALWERILYSKLRLLSPKYWKGTKNLVPSWRCLKSCGNFKGGRNSRLDIFRAGWVWNWNSLSLLWRIVATKDRESSIQKILGLRIP